MRIYVSGPMAGYTELNFPAFKKVTAYLREYGHEVLCPTELGLELEAMDPPPPWQEFLWNDIEEICKFKPHAIVMLDGWRKSRGACIEHAFLEAMNCVVIPEDQLYRIV